MPEQMGPAADVYQRFAQSWAERCNDDQDERIRLNNYTIELVIERDKIHLGSFL